MTKQIIRDAPKDAEYFRVSKGELEYFLIEFDLVFYWNGMEWIELIGYDPKEMGLHKLKLDWMVGAAICLIMSAVALSLLLLDK